MTAPVISANIRTNHSGLAAQIKPYHVFPEHSMAVIGLTTIHTKTTSSPDAGTDFLDPVQVLQNTVDEINRKEKVDRIIAMTHIGESTLLCFRYHSECRWYRLQRRYGIGS